MFCIVSNKKHFKWQKKNDANKNATHFFSFSQIVRHAKKKPQKNVQKKFISVKPNCPFKHLRIYNSSLLIIFFKQNEVQKYILLQINGKFSNWIFLFLINFRRFKWGIKERFQLLTSPCILIFKEILLQLRALNGDNMV